MRALQEHPGSGGLLLAGLLAVFFGGWNDGALPRHERLLPGLAGEPVQAAPLRNTAYSVKAGGVDYGIRPQADYDIQGLVVSRHDSTAWWDWIHAASNDHLNVVDLCVVWGANAAEGAYEKMKFSSGQFVCYVSTKDNWAWQPQFVRALSNNHLLTDDSGIARTLRNVRIGDQIRIRGQLVEYTHNHGFAFVRGTSLTRDDQGNGACETIFVREATVLRGGDAWPRWLFRVGLLMLAAGLWLWFAAPHRPRD